MALTADEARRVDCEVAEKVMGWFQTPHPNPRMLFPGVTPGNVWWPPGFDYHAVKDDFGQGLANGVAFPNYSTDIAAAWEVVEKLNLAVMPWRLGDWEKRKGWWAGRFDYDREDPYEVLDKLAYGVFAETAPHAICKAALKALEKEAHP